MAKKQFKTESKRLLDLMINSIYTHKEIFLRELISNASDAIDKLYFRSLTDDSVKTKREDYEIRLIPNKEERTLIVKDNGIGMTKEELEKNLGTIAKSGSLDFKTNPDSKENAEIDIIGQFGVGFYSAFMVSDQITVESRAYGEATGARWMSSGVDGYTVEDFDKGDVGTTVILHLKPDTEEASYSEFLEPYRLQELVKQYSDYVRYPIRMMVSHTHKQEDGTEEVHSEDQTLNSMTPLWKRDTSEVSEEEYATFYREKFYDYEKPLRVIRQKTDGTSEYIALLFIPGKAPYDYYSREYEKGLQLYSSGVLIMDKCKELLPDYFSFVRGLVDSSDLSLNISREMLQHDRQVAIIARALEKKIASELEKMLKEDRDKYEQFFDAFGTQLKVGAYSDFGMHKELLQDLLLFHTAGSDSRSTLKEIVSRMPSEQKSLYYASGETLQQVKLLPQVRAAVEKGFEVLCLVEDVDEFTLQILREYDGKSFVNLLDAQSELSNEEETAQLKEANEKASDFFQRVKDVLGDSIQKVEYSALLSDQAAFIGTEGPLSLQMQKVLSKMPGAENAPKAELVLQLNPKHPLIEKLAEADEEALKKTLPLLYASACLSSGIELENTQEVSQSLVNLLEKTL